jgi:hypothetical protein
MAATSPTDSPFRELAHRTNDGVEVVLFWHEVTSDLTVCVADARSGAYFELPAPPERALDVFHHPYAYAALERVLYDDALLASWAPAAAVDGPRHVEQPQTKT